MRRSSEAKSVSIFSVIVGAKLGMQKVMSGQVDFCTSVECLDGYTGLCIW